MGSWKDGEIKTRKRIKYTQALDETKPAFVQVSVFSTLDVIALPRLASHISLSLIDPDAMVAINGDPTSFDFF